jgi:E3 ubiquitin-protein ligase KCMF1
MSTVPDPLLSSFVGHFIEVDLPKDAPQELLDETHVRSDSLEQKAVERYENLFTTITKPFSPKQWLG